MLNNMKKYWFENWETICAGFIIMNGGYYRPYAR